MPSLRHSLVDVAREAADTARRARPIEVEVKGFQDFVTDLDRSLEALIADRLRRLFPDVPVLGEESLRAEDRLPPRCFLVDPLDGTGNWIAGLPIAAVSIALLDRGRTVGAAVADIQTGTIYSAEQGAGADCDGRRLGQPERPSSLICLSTGFLDASLGGEAYRGLRTFGKVRNIGCQSLQLCAVASGVLSLCASVEARLWDDAAGRLVATEAGAIYRSHVRADDVDRPSAKQHSLCAHPTIHAEAEAAAASVLAATAGEAAR